MEGKFVKYRSFNDKALATELYQKLSEAGLPVAWEDTEGFFDVTFANNEILHLYYVKIEQEDFKRADELLMNSVLESDQQPIADYYLFSFADDELIDVLKNPDEWNAFDLYWAKKILTSRGVGISEEELEQGKIKKIEELKHPWILDKLWIVCTFSLWVLAFWFIHYLIAAAVVFISAYISYSKKTMPDGQRVMAFSETDRLLGKVILVAGVALEIFILLQYYGVIDFMRPL
ncbi:MAG: hypothetical protein ABI675_28280 [Chitinophagaceae bacterium]